MEDNIVHRISSFFHPTAPHFFKIILQQTIRTGKLVVPKKFVRKYGKDLSLSNAVILKVPNGDAWEVELRKGASDVWLQKGWLDFANFYSIKHGYFLVFKYEPGSSNGFDVVVFDKSATEIEYPMKSKSLPGRMLQSYLGQHKSGKMELLVSGDKNGSGWKAFVVDNNIVLGDVCVFELKRGLKNVSLKVSIFRAPRVADSRILRSQAKKKQKIAQSSEFQLVAFISERRPSFQMVMTEGILSHRFLRIPTRFAKEQINLKLQKQMATLQIEDRSWPVKLIISGHPCPQVMFSGGLGAFLKDNSLKAGDLCTFELIQKAEIVFRTSIRAKNVKKD
ncbi:hypothetical protein CRG98_031168 [Punica granatum]|uniref:TF-B3 domain-containing protein n=1 Tax=Punica granatum TaxID=22663 RepID=A0A2I0IWQ2_PUNGR|nr:hypothetical protein CRG98_031168 [Punica granatum]